MPLKSIFLLGDFSSDRLGASYRRAFQLLNLQTFVLDEGESRRRLGWSMRNRVGHRLTIRSRWARKLASKRFNRLIEEAALRSNAPVVLIFKGEFIMPETLHRLRRKGVRVILFHPDNPFPPHSSHRPESLAAARETDLYLIWSQRLVSRLQEAGVPHPVFLPFAWDPEVFPFQPCRPQKTWPGVLFLGGWDREREEFLEKLASRVPLRIYGPSYWGTRTARLGRVRRCWQGTDLRMASAAEAIGEAAVCVNLLRTQHVIDGAPDGLIMRHFEVPGAGGFLLSTRGGGATDLFPEGETGEYFSDLTECVEKARYYIANVADRRRLAESAHAEVASHHLYRNRVQTILQLLDGF